VHVSVVGAYDWSLPKNTNHVDKTPAFTVLAQQSTSVTVRFNPPPLNVWMAGGKTIFDGTLVAHYPGDGNEPQKFKLTAFCYRPDLEMRVVEIPEPPKPPYLLPPWGPSQPSIIDFRCVHVQSSIAAKRSFWFTNHSRCPANWKIFHVAANKPNINQKSVGLTLAEIEDAGACDDPTAFQFNDVEGVLAGPCNPIRLAPLGPALPHLIGHEDEKDFQPVKIDVAFKPRKNILYKCRFRITCEGGTPLDFILRGVGSYDETDDILDIQEA